MARGNVKFPADLVTEILLKLPVKSIIRFRCVAKSWYHLFTNPTFVYQHLSLSKKSRDNSHSLVVDFIADSFEKSMIGLLSLSDDQTLVSYHDFHQELPSHVADSKEYVSIAVGDGLVCLYDCHDCGITLWNPATKEFRILPHCNIYMPRPEDYYIFLLIGSGMDPLSNDYKVLYIRAGRGEFKNQYAIYRMSRDSWRALKEEDVKIVENLASSISRNQSNTCINGVCYWMVYPAASDCAKVLTFQLSTEVFQLLRSPVPGNIGLLIPLHDNRIAFWDAANMNGRTDPCAVWVLNDEENWTKLINIDPVPNVVIMYGFRTHGKVFVEGEEDERLRLYDLETREFSDIGFKARFAWVYTYEESLIAVNRK